MQRKVPSAIENITLSRATFTNVPITDLTFVNFFYGNNGAGKSSIAHAIEEDDGVVWADGKSADDYDVLVYNQNFISENFVSYGDLKGVFIFGEEDIEAKKRIATLTEEKKKKSDAKVTAGEEYKQKTAGVDAALTQFQDTCFSKTADIRKRFEKCMDGKKQKRNFAEAVLGEKSPKEHDLPELERLYGVAFDDTARAYAEFKKAGATTYGSLPGKELLDKVIVSSSDTPFARFLKALGSTASDWVRDGHTHFSGSAGGKCPYCQQKLPANFENEIAATFDAQYQQDIRDLGQFQTTYSRETADIVRVLQTNTADAMPSLDLKAYQERLSLLESKFEVNRQRIAEKVKEPSKTVSLEDTDTLLLEIGAMIDDINKLIKANNDVVAAKKSSKEKCKTEIMQHLAFLLADEVTSYKDEVARLKTEIDDVTERGKKLKKEIGELTTQISELNKHNANTEAAIDSINKILRDSGFQGFSIRAKDGVENVYEIVRENGTVAENLSEGERNFIAFLYFYHRVRGSMNSEELKEKIVVIDDPVSSMDSTALFIVSAIVREMINVCRNNTEYLNPQVPGDYIKQLFTDLHKKYNFITYLLAYINIKHPGGGYNLDGKIKATNFVQKKAEEHTDPKLVAQPVVKLPTAESFGLTEAKEERLSQIIAEINSRTGKAYDNDVAVKAMLQIRDILLKSDKLKTSARNNTVKDFEFSYFDDIDDALIEGLEQNQDFFSLLLSNDEIKKQVLGIFTEEIYKSLREA